VEVEFAEAVASTQWLIELVRQLDEAYQLPGKERATAIQRLRPTVDQEIDQHPLTRERAPRWKEEVRRNGGQELTMFLRDHITTPEDAWLPVQNDGVIAVPFIVVGAAATVGTIASWGKGEPLAGTLVMGVVAILAVSYLFAWVRVRVGERRVMLDSDTVWLPATGLAIRSHRVSYTDIQAVELGGHANRQLRVVIPGGAARFRDSWVRVRELADELKKRIEWHQRRVWMLEQFAKSPARSKQAYR